MDMPVVEVAQKNNEQKQKPKNKKKQYYKPKQDIILKLFDKEYMFHQICIVTTHAPIARVGLQSIDHEKAVKHPSDVVNNGIIRLLKYEQVNKETRKNEIRYTLVSGFNKLQQYISKNEEVLSVEAQLVNRSHLDRCLVPPKTLDVSELREKITSDVFANAGFTVRVGKQKCQNQAAS